MLEEFNHFSILKSLELVWIFLQSWVNSSELMHQIHLQAFQAKRQGLYKHIIDFCYGIIYWQHKTLYKLLDIPCANEFSKANEVSKAWSSFSMRCMNNVSILLAKQTQSLDCFCIDVSNLLCYSQLAQVLAYPYQIEKVLKI